MFTRDWHGRILIREKVIQPLHKVQVVAEMSCERVGQVGDQISGYLETIVQVIIPVRAHLELYECWMNLHGQQRCVWWAYPSKSSHHRHQVVIVFLSGWAPVRQVITFRRLDRITTNCCDRRSVQSLEAFSIDRTRFSCRVSTTSKVHLPVGRELVLCRGPEIVCI